MTATGWRNLCLVLGALCAVLQWRSCTATAPSRSTDTSEIRTRGAVVRTTASTAPDHRRDPARTAAPPAAPSTPASGAVSLYGFTVPRWAVWLAPHPGEDLRAYRDRMLPIAQAAIAPQRARVARSRDSFAALAGLDAHQRAELDGAARDTAAQLQDRVVTAVLGGELAPATFKPMAGVALARELFDIVGAGNQRFLASLRDDQRARLARHPFDFGDYLVFSTPWEDALALLDYQ